MKLFELIYYQGNYQDFVYLVSAMSHVIAAEEVWLNGDPVDHGGKKVPWPDIICEMGEEISFEDRQGHKILRRYNLPAAYSHGWRQWKLLDWGASGKIFPKYEPYESTSTKEQAFPLKLYETVWFERDERKEIDIIKFIRASDPVSAAEFARTNSSHYEFGGHKVLWPDVIYELGGDLTEPPGEGPKQLRGPYRGPVINHGWREWRCERDPVRFRPTGKYVEVELGK